jgi:lipid-binding SYLF domain-containing protein
MMKRFARLLMLPLVALLGIVPHAAQAQAKQEYRLALAADVLDELRRQRDDVIPERLLQRAYAVAVVPGVLKGAFIVGGRYGSGVVVVRDNRGRFSNPVFITLSGGSVGWQVGGQSTDVVLVFTSRRGVEGLAGGKVTLGAGASVAAGPVGRQGEAAAGLDAEVFSYSRNRGLFAGVSLEGTALAIDRSANSRFYGRKDVLASEIMAGSVTKDSENVRRFLAAIAASTGETASAPAAPAAPTAPAATPAPAAAPAEAAKTFPMEDRKPGAEPR